MFWIKVVISALLIGASSEVAKRLPWVGAILISLPLSSVLALTWLYLDTRDSARVAVFSDSIFWAVLPSLLLFLVLSLLLRRGWGFPASLAAACITMVLGYWIYAWALRRFFNLDI